jgi:hypothetical protein
MVKSRERIRNLPKAKKEQEFYNRLRQIKPNGHSLAERQYGMAKSSERIRNLPKAKKGQELYSRLRQIKPNGNGPAERQ